MFGMVKRKKPKKDVAVIAPLPRGMTSKQDVFCMCVADPQVANNTAAYREAFDCSNMSPITVNNEAYKLTRRPDITARIDSWRNYFAGGRRYSLNEAIEGQERAVELAAATGAAGAMSGAYREIAKLSDLYPKEEAPPSPGDTTINNTLIVELPRKELARRMLHIIQAGVLEG